MRFTVGSVPYLNAKPLVKPLLWQGESSPVQIKFAVPSQLPQLLDSGRAEAILVSSVSALADPGAKIAAGLSISTQRKVLSVRLFSKVPFAKIETLAEDSSSMTSNLLARLILADQFNARPRVKNLPPDADAMLREGDACILIGDNGMRFEGQGLHVLDLGEAWYDLTELPFVWAVWKGRDGLSPQLVGHLQTTLHKSFAELERVIEESAAETGFSPEQCRRYLVEIMDYRLDEAHLKGLREFAKRLERHDLLTNPSIPERIEPPKTPPNVAASST